MLSNLLCKCRINKTPICGLTLMILAQVCFACAWAVIKQLGKELPLFEIIFFRAFFGLLIIVPIALKKYGTLKGNNNKLLILRGCTGFIGMITTFYAMIHLHLGDAALTINTAPIFVALFSVIFLKEKISKAILFWIFIAFVGLILILKPTPTLFKLPSLLGISGGIVIAITMMIIRKLHETDNSIMITLYFTLIVTIGVIPFMIPSFIMPSIQEIVLLAIIATFVTGAQLLLTKSFSFAPPIVIAPFSYLSVIIAYIIELVVWSHIPTFLSIVGAVLVISSGVLITISAAKPKKIRIDAVPVLPSSIAELTPIQK